MCKLDERINEYVSVHINASLINLIKFLLCYALLHIILSYTVESGVRDRVLVTTSGWLHRLQRILRHLQLNGELSYARERSVQCVSVSFRGNRGRWQTQCRFHRRPDHYRCNTTLAFIKVRRISINVIANNMYCRATCVLTIFQIGFCREQSVCRDMSCGICERVVQHMPTRLLRHNRMFDKQ